MEKSFMQIMKQIERNKGLIINTKINQKSKGMAPNGCAIIWALTNSITISLPSHTSYSQHNAY
jgi:hypothetical protein